MIFFKKHSSLIVFSFIILVCILGYYFFIFSPAQNSDKKQAFLQNQIKCSDLGQKYVDKNVDEETPYGALYENPQYAFSEELNTCLYRKEFSTYWSDGSLATKEFEIIDVYSNTVVANIFEHYDSEGKVNDSSGDRQKYQKLIKDYFEKD